MENKFLFSESDIVNKEYYKSIKDVINCSICSDIIKDPVQCNKCQHCFCSLCIKRLRNCRPCNCQFNQFIPSLICKNLLSELIIKCSCGDELKYDFIQKHKEDEFLFKMKCSSLGNQNGLLQSESQQLKQELIQLKQELNNCKQELNKYKQKNIAFQKKFFISNDKLFISCSLHEHQIECLRRYYTTWLCDKCNRNFEIDIPSYHCTLCDFDLCLNCAHETVIKDINSTRFSVQKDVPGLNAPFLRTPFSIYENKNNAISWEEKIGKFIDAGFDFIFLKLENNKKNMLYSPLSIKYALNMLQKGAENNTLVEINKIIGNNKPPKYPNSNTDIKLANGLFIRDVFYNLVKANYINTLKDEYNSEVIKDSFISANNVNKWIENKTLGIIKNILSDEIVKNPDVGMLIINALAIDITWSVLFNRNNTHGQTFYKDDGQKIEVAMMSLDRIKDPNIAYYKDNNITVLTMNLKENNNTQLEFMAIMPKENLSAYVENVSSEQINEITTKLRPSSLTPDGVNVKIPKFKFDYDLKLKKDLMDLGIKDAFNENTANFSKIVDLETRRIYVTDALHKTNIEFTEKGARAAAATIIVIGGTIALPGGNTYIPEPINIIIDKPFMFIIRDKKTKDVWFTGTVYKPNLWENDKLSYCSPFFSM